jgi:alkylated DNA repair dioxygenase AlkB
VGAKPKRTPATRIASAQPALFPHDDALPAGLRLEPALIDAAAELELLAPAARLPLQAARHHQYSARRRVHMIEPAHFPPVLQRLRERLAAFAGIEAGEFVHALFSEYGPGTPLGWHRDAPMYERVCGVSLGGPARLRLRAWPRQAAGDERIVELELAPRSAYLLEGAARWGWQHSVPPVPALRYSVTMRTARAR